MQQVKGTNYSYMNNLDNIRIRNDAEQKHKRLHIMLFHLIKFKRQGKTKQYIV